METKMIKQVTRQSLMINGVILLWLMTIAMLQAQLTNTIILPNLAQLTYTLNVPTMNDNGGYLIAADAVDADTTTNRHQLPITITGNINRSGTISGTVYERVIVTLFDSAGQRVPLKDGAGTTTDLVVDNRSFTYSTNPFIGTNPVNRPININTSIEPVGLPLKKDTYQLEVKIQALNTAFGAWNSSTTKATNVSAVRTITSFPSIDPNDEEKNLLLEVNGFTLARRVRVQNVAGQENYTAQANLQLTRYDNWTGANTAQTISGRVIWSMAIETDNGPSVHTIGEVPLTLSLAPYQTAEPGTLPLPVTATVPFTLPYAPTNPFFPGLLETAKLTARFYTNEGSLGEKEHTSKDAYGRVGTFSGKLYGGSALATFTELSFDETSVVASGVNQLVKVTIPSATIVGSSFPVNNVQLLYNSSNGDLSVPTGVVIPVGPAQFSIAGVNGTLVGAGLTANGLRATQARVSLPAGFGYTLSPRGRALESELIFNDIALTPQGYPASAELVFTSTGDFYLAHEQVPHRFQTDKLTWDVPGGRFYTQGVAKYVRRLEQQWLANAANANPNVLNDRSAAEKPSNEAHYRSTNETATVGITVTGAGALTTNIILNGPHVQSYTTHFPRRASVSPLNGEVNINQGAFAPTSYLNLTAPVSLSYSQNSPEGGCGVTQPGQATLTLQANNLTITPDGGWRTTGQLVGSPTLRWGGVHQNAQPTHQIFGATNASLLLAGTHLRSANHQVPDPVLKCATLLLSGIGQGNNGTYTERPYTTDYVNTGAADYPGINILGSNNTLMARSYLAGKDTATYPLKPLVKYYLRGGGITGVHDAITANFPKTLKFYDYDTTIDGFRLSFLDNTNKDSATAGSLNLPYPSAIGLNFSNLLFTSSGGLKEAKIPENQGAKTLAYWKTSITPVTMEFKGTNGCNSAAAEPRSLVLSGEVRLASSIYDQPIYGSLAFAKGGDLLSAADNLEGGIDSSLVAPAVMKVKQTSTLSYPLRPVTKLRHNSWTQAGSPPSNGPKGFVYTAGTIDVSFFEDIRVLAHFEPDGLGKVHLMGGYKTDPSQMERGWTVGGNNFFNDTKFDSENRGFPVGISLQDFRAGVANTNQYRVHVRRDWRKLVKFELPVIWNPTARRFNGQSMEQNLVVIDAKAQLKSLDARGAEITFGAELSTGELDLTKLSTEGLSLLIERGAEELTDINRKISDALARVLTNQLDRLALKDARKAADDLIADTLNQITDAPLRAALESLLADGSIFNLDQLHQNLSSAYNGAANRNLSALDNSLFTALQDVQKIKNLVTGAINEILSATAQVDTLIKTIDMRLVQVDNGLASVEKIIGSDSSQPNQRLGDIVIKLARELLKDLVGLNLDNGSVPAQARQELNDLLKTLEGDMGPTLKDLAVIIKDARKVITTLRGQLSSGGAMVTQLQRALQSGDGSNMYFETSIVNAVNQFQAEIKNSQDTAKRFFEENTPVMLRRRLVDLIIVQLHSSQISGELRKVMLQLVDPVRSAFNESLDSALSLVNTAVSEVAVKGIQHATGAAARELENKIQSLFAEEKQANGDIPKERNDSSNKSVMVMAKIQGVARTKGDTLDFLRVDGEVAIKVPDGVRFKGYFQIQNFDSDSPQVSCRSVAGGVQTEISMGATVAISMQAGDNKAEAPGGGRKLGFYLEIEVDTKFSLNSAGSVVGFDGYINVKTNMLDFGGISITQMKLGVGFGGGEAYMFGTSAGSVWLIEMQLNTFMGMTKQFKVLERATSEKSALTLKAALVPNASGCFNNAVVGVCYSGSGHISLNRFFGIPDTCLFSLRAGVLFDSICLIYKEAADTHILLGQGFGFSVTGDLLCLIGFDVNLGVIFTVSGSLSAALNAVGKPNADSILAVANSLRATAHGYAKACVSLVFEEVCASVDVIGVVSLKGTPPTPKIDWKVKY